MDNTDSFNIDSSSNIVLYGCSLACKKLAENLLQSGYKVDAFLDINAQNIKRFLDLPVFSPEAFGNLVCDKENVIIIICLQNILQHWISARNLINCGFRNLLYLPNEMFIPQGSISKMRECYNACINGDYNMLVNIPVSNLIDKSLFNIKIKIIREVGNRVVIFVPGVLLYSSPYEYVAENAEMKNISDDIKKTTGKNIYSIEPYWDLFGFVFNQENIYPLDYLSIFAGVDKSKQQTLLKDRCRLFGMFWDELNKGLDFFIGSAPYCKLGDNGKFIVLDGLHRSIFLSFNNHALIPVSISKSDYDILCDNVNSQINMSDLSKCCSDIVGGGMTVCLI